MFNNTIPLTISGNERTFEQRNTTKDGYTVFAWTPPGLPYTTAHRAFLRLQAPTEPNQGSHRSEFTVKVPDVVTSATGAKTVVGTSEVKISARVSQHMTDASADELVAYIAAIAADGTLRAMVGRRSTIPIGGNVAT